MVISGVVVSMLGFALMGAIGVIIGLIAYKKHHSHGKCIHNCGMCVNLCRHRGRF